LSFQDDKPGRRRRKSEPELHARTGEQRRRRPPASDVGDALRCAYDRVVDEDIPPEMLDLLGKLG
jgi:hypothetical protein